MEDKTPEDKHTRQMYGVRQLIGTNTILCLWTDAIFYLGLLAIDV